jgi:hypothetical protein
MSGSVEKAHLTEMENKMNKKPKIKTGKMNSSARLIGIIGRKRSGKDTIGDHLVRKYGFMKYSFATPLKEACKAMFGFSDEQLNGDLKEVVDPEWNVTPRLVMQYFGTELMRKGIGKILPEVGEDFWVVCFEKFYLKNMNKKIVVTDVRYPNERDIIKKLGGIVIGVVRPSIQYIDNHISETSVDVNTADMILINDGTVEELLEKVSKN